MSLAWPACGARARGGACAGRALTCNASSPFALPAIYIPRAAAGNGVIQRYCGKDSTAAFNRAHRPSTAAMLKRYKIGKAVKG